MENWETTTLGEVCKRGGGNIQTGPFGSQLHASDYVSEGIPSIMPVNIGENRINREGIARITTEDAERLEKYRVREGDIVYSRRGDVERRALIRKQEDGWLCGTGCLRIRFGEGVVDSLFASYYLGDSEVRQWIVRHAVGATMPNLNTSILSALPFVVPPIEEQKAIAKILSSLDDKIELNRQMNATLEAMARAVFKAWFVDFEPVRANSENRPSQSASPEIAKLFPSEFENDIPKGWQEKKIGDFIQISYGKNLPTTKLKNSGYPVFGGNGIIGFYDSYLYEKPQVLVACRGAASGKINQSLPLSFVTNNSLILQTDEKTEVGFNYLKHFMQNIDTTSFVTGSAQPQVTIENIKHLQVVVPNQNALFNFEKFGKSIEEQILKNQEQNNLLSEIRDSLLPRLISGKIRVGEAENETGIKVSEIF